MSRKIYIVLIVCSFFMVSCAVSKNPREGGLFGGLYGVNSGAYDERIQQRNEQLALEKSVNTELRDKSEALEKEAQLKDSMLSIERKKMKSIQKDIVGLESSINKLNAKSESKKKEIASIKSRIKDFQARIASHDAAIGDLDEKGGSAKDPDRYRLLVQERDQLAEEYKRLNEHFETLSRSVL